METDIEMTLFSLFKLGGAAACFAFIMAYFSFSVVSDKPIEAQSNTTDAYAFQVSVTETNDTEKTAEKKVLLTGNYLEFVGGYRVPTVIHENFRSRAISFDLLPGTTIWASGHPKKQIITYQEPNVSTEVFHKVQSELDVLSQNNVMQDAEKLAPTAVHWIDENTILASGRKNYRSGYEENWLVKYSLLNSAAEYYDINRDDGSLSNFEVLQAYGSGFSRYQGSEFAEYF